MLVIEHDWIAQVINDLSSVDPILGFDSNSSREFIEADTQIIRPIFGSILRPQNPSHSAEFC